MTLCRNVVEPMDITMKRTWLLLLASPRRRSTYIVISLLFLAVWSAVTIFRQRFFVHFAQEEAHPPGSLTDNRREASSENNNSKSRKLFFIVHIGPPKTATTTLQWELTSLKKVLRSDGIVYMGMSHVLERGKKLLVLPWIRTRSSSSASSSFAETTKRLPLSPFHTLFRDYQCHREMRHARHRFRFETGLPIGNATTFSAMSPPAYFASLYNSSSFLKSLHIFLYQRVTCFRKLKAALLPHRQERASIIISDETLSLSRTQVDWVSVSALMTVMDYQLQVVVGYRRYAEWLPSAKQQLLRWTPGKPRLSAWPSQGGKRLVPLFPDWYRQVEEDPHYMPYKFTHTLAQELRTLHHSVRMVGDPLNDWDEEQNTTTTTAAIAVHIPFEILNVHDARLTSGNMSISTYFVCDILPGATATCLYARQRDQQRPPLPEQDQEQLNLSSSSTSFSFYSAFQHLGSTLASIFGARPFPADLPSRRFNPSQSYHYDMLAVAAAEQGWIPSSARPMRRPRRPPPPSTAVLVDRHEAALAIQFQQEQVLHLTDRDFPLLCPPRSDLEFLLNRSLELETAIFLSASDLPSNGSTSGLGMTTLDDEDAPLSTPLLLRRQEHEREFWYLAARQHYCWIDTDATLQMASWQSFFRERYGS